MSTLSDLNQRSATIIQNVREIISALNGIKTDLVDMLDRVEGQVGTGSEQGAKIQEMMKQVDYSVGAGAQFLGQITRLNNNLHRSA
jgi:methyl-accepting chemotaxis protein